MPGTDFVVRITHLTPTRGLRVGMFEEPQGNQTSGTPGYLTSSGADDVQIRSAGALVSEAWEASSRSSTALFGIDRNSR